MMFWHFDSNLCFFFRTAMTELYSFFSPFLLNSVCLDELYFVGRSQNLFKYLKCELRQTGWKNFDRRQNPSGCGRCERRRIFHKVKRCFLSRWNADVTVRPSGRVMDGREIFRRRREWVRSPVSRAKFTESHHRPTHLVIPLSICLRV